LERDMAENDDKVMAAVNEIRGAQRGAEEYPGMRERLAAFLSAQQDVYGPVEVAVEGRPSTGTAGGNLIFTATADFGKGREPRRFVLRYRMEEGVVPPWLVDLSGQSVQQRCLYEAGVPTARVRWTDWTGTWIGVPGFVMDFVRCRVPPQDYYKSGVLAEADPPIREHMLRDIVRTQARIHAVDWRAAGLGFLGKRGRGKTPIERETDWYCAMLRITRPDLDPMARRLEKWVRDSQPLEQREILLHGDSNVGNYFFADSSADIVAVSDFEFGFLGPPECDLAWFFMVNDAFRPSGWAGDPGNEALALEYERASGRRLGNMEFYYTFSTARLAFVLRAGLSRLGADSEAAVLAGPWGTFERHFLAHS
jgi:aminoglycoside phosphotransferase (APT) family kinase protein